MAWGGSTWGSRVWGYGDYTQVVTGIGLTGSVGTVLGKGGTSVVITASFSMTMYSGEEYQWGGVGQTESVYTWTEIVTA